MRIELIKGNTRIKTTIKTLACFCLMVYHLHIKHGETDDTTHFRILSWFQIHTCASGGVGHYSYLTWMSD